MATLDFSDWKCEPEDIFNGDFDWEPFENGIKLTGYKGSSTRIRIPAEYPAGSGRKVIALEGTFAGNTTVESVIVPDTVWCIAKNTFHGCTSLRDIFIPDSVVRLDIHAFDGSSRANLHCSRNSCAYVIADYLATCNITVCYDDDMGDLFKNELDMSACESSDEVYLPEPDGYFSDSECTGSGGYSDSFDSGYSGSWDAGDSSAGWDDSYSSWESGECSDNWDGGDFDACPAPPCPPAACPTPCPPVAACPPPPAPSFGRREESMPSLKMEAKKTEAVKVKPVRTDKVSFSALSPEKVEKGTYSSVLIYMYTKSQRKVVDRAIKEAKQAVSETTKSGFSAGRGSEVTIELCSDDVEVKDNRDSRIWNGGSESFDFMFFVPEDYSKKQIGFTCYVYINGVQITRLNFSVALRSAGKSVPVKLKRRDNRHVFVSYAHKDTQRVIAQLLDIQELAPKMTFWLDSQSLETGDVWRKEIKRAIDKADALFLFWSIYSKGSSEVEKEWRYALSKKGSGFITPVPLDPVDICPPPHELSHRHFSHRSFHYTPDMDKLNFRNSKRVRIIK